MPGIGSMPCPKPPRGQHRLDRLKLARERRAKEEAAKRLVRARDGHRCRVPQCEHGKTFAVHVAHLEDKGMGGDKQQQRTQVNQMLCLCWFHHEGPISLHSKDLRIEPESSRGTDGPCLFFVADEQTKWRAIGRG